MKIEKVKIDKLVSPSYNPRDITPEKLESLKKSIEEFGYIDPLIVNKVNMHIVGGNQRYEALKQLGVKEVEVSYVEIEDEGKEKALNIRLNNSSGEWNEIKLQNLLEELKVENVDISLTGFEDIKIETYDDFNFNDNLFDNEDDDVEEYTPSNYTNMIEDTEYDNSDLEDLYSEEDNIQTDIRASNFDNEWGLTTKIRFGNPIDEDLFYKFIEDIKDEYGGDTITDNLLTYFDKELEKKINAQQFKSDFEIIFKNEDEKSRYANVHNQLRIRYPKSREPLIDFIKEFENGLQS